MKNVIRTWKDATDRQGLPAEKQAVIRTNLADEIELTDAELETVYGAGEEEECCGGVTQVGLLNLNLDLL